MQVANSSGPSGLGAICLGYYTFPNKSSKDSITDIVDGDLGIALTFIFVWILVLNAPRT